MLHSTCLLLRDGSASTTLYTSFPKISISSLRGFFILTLEGNVSLKKSQLETFVLHWSQHKEGSDWVEKDPYKYKVDSTHHGRKGDHAEEFEKGLPLSVSIERMEQALSKLNKAHMNNNKLDAEIKSSEDMQMRHFQVEKIKFHEAGRTNREKQ